MARVQAHMVYVDEKWLKIRGRWQDWFVVFDVATELPGLARLTALAQPVGLSLARRSNCARSNTSPG